MKGASDDISPLLKILLWLPTVLTSKPPHDPLPLTGAVSLCALGAGYKEQLRVGLHSPRLWLCLLSAPSLPPRLSSPSTTWMNSTQPPGSKSFLQFLLQAPKRGSQPMTAPWPACRSADSPDDALPPRPSPAHCLTQKCPQNLIVFRRGVAGGRDNRRMGRSLTHLYCSLACITTKSHL